MSNVNPDFSERNKFIQPQAKVCRASYRSPIDSEALNLSYNSIYEDILYLYGAYENAAQEAAERLSEIYEEGKPNFSDGNNLGAMIDYANDLRAIRQEIEDIKGINNG